MTQEEQALIYTGSLELKDGQVNFIQDTQMHAHYGGYHPQTNTVFYGGHLEMVDPLTLRIGQRYIRIQSGDRAEMVSKVAEQCDAWHNIDDNDEVRGEIQAMTAQLRILNPETRELLGSAQAQQFVTPESEPKAPGISVRLRLAEGVGLRSMPKGGWTLQPDGNITDADGHLMYIKAQGEPGASTSRATAAPSGGAQTRPTPVSPRPAVTAQPQPQPSGGLMGQLRRLFRGE